ncbi:MAG: hypothetical protein B7Z44_09140 [Caulobacter sp. 12-67-6]|nr:MAG: hypothetical protein B7Z44_09140 [Caulobacter sp. 12-67-6]OYX70974.1 MAG: hypothetical protein B7Y81_10310 [Caulobacter sp. 32-67-35]OYX95362.1 MAG: hypothetical protein B7Y78_05220 [Caulobacter sp. 35-67-4]OZA71942.1 MAG: hypothetical protein B7X77_12815 [Caulobacter sp. 39-67-4]HQR91296.1 hypothetical protein [Caulobacter sp.]
MRRPILIAASVAAAGLALAGCEKQIKAPFEKGVCFHVVTNKDKTLRFNPVERNVPSMEQCAATLEGMRIRFVRMGSANRTLTGSYQGSFIFVEKEGIYLGQTYDGARFMSLVRTGDGRLAVPGAIREVPAP